MFDLANLVFAIDLSASTADSVGSDANFDGIANAADDLNQDGSIGDILDVEVGSLLRILQNLRDKDIHVMVSIVAFATFADHVDLSPLAFNQTFASPTADMNADFRRSKIDDRIGVELLKKAVNSVFLLVNCHRFINTET